MEELYLNWDISRTEISIDRGKRTFQGNMSKKTEVGKASKF